MDTTEIYDDPRKNDPRLTPLGHVLTSETVETKIKTIFGAVSWPGKNPGFAVVLGVSRRPRLDGRDVFLLDEYESDDMRVLVHQCGVLNQKYKPYRWIGDPRNDSADRFRREMNEQNRTDLSFQTSTIFDIELPYQYLLPKLKHLLDAKAKTLFLKDSKVLDYMGSINADEIPETPWGTYPAIEAVALGVIELTENWDAEEKKHEKLRRIREMQEKYRRPR